MSKRKLKEQHQWANYNMIDILSSMDPSNTNKFLPLMVKHLKSQIESRNKRNEGDRKHILEEIYHLTKTPITNFKNYNIIELERVHEVSRIFGYENFSLLKEFNEHLNHNRISENDVLKYKSFEEILEAVKIASLKQAQKELKSSTHIVFEDENWLMIKPLTFESSRKYGAGTKWCTTMENNKSYFYRYSISGILIYIFNKDTKVKTAAHIDLREKDEYDNPIKLYNEKDVESDSYILQLPKQVMETLIEEQRKSITNQNFIKESYPKIYEGEWQNWTEENNNETYLEQVPIPFPVDVTDEEPIMGLDEVNGGDNEDVLRFNYGEFEGTPSAPSTIINGPITLDDVATESLREQLFEGKNDFDDIIKKLNEYTKTSKLKNLWRKWFGPKVVVVGVPEGTMPYERWVKLGEELNNNIKGNYKFIMVWTYKSKEVTFTTL